MKPSYFTPIVGGGLLALGLAISPLTPPASATLDSFAYTYMVTQPKASDGTSNHQNDFNWNWIGLEGLLGLAGLSACRRKESGGNEVTCDDYTIEPSVACQTSYCADERVNYKQLLTNKEGRKSQAALGCISSRTSVQEPGIAVTSVRVADDY